MSPKLTKRGFFEKPRFSPGFKKPFLSPMGWAFFKNPPLFFFKKAQWVGLF